MGLKKSFLLLSLSCLAVAFLLLGAVIFLCRGIESYYPLGGVEILSDGSIVPLPSPTASQQRILAILNIVQTLSCILFPVGGLIVSVFLFYYLKLKWPISCLQNGIMRIQNNDLDFSLPILSNDEMGQLCAAFEEMRSELLKSNRLLWQQAEERKRLNAAFSHDLRNPITVLKGSVKLLRQGIQDEQTIDRLESYTLRIEQYVEAMSSVQKTLDGYDGYLGIGNGGFTNGVQVIVDDAIYERLTGKDTYSEFLPTLNEGADRENFDTFIEAFCNRIPGTTFLSYEETDQQLKESFAQIQMLAWGLILFVGLIGILNIINTVYTNIHTRVTEIGMQRAIGMSAGSLYKTFLWEGAYYGIIASVIGSVLGYVCTIFIEAATSDTLQLVAIPVIPILEATLLAVGACLMATAIPLRKISKMSIVDSIETVE